MRHALTVIAPLLVALCAGTVAAQPNYSRLVSPDQHGKLRYTPDERGNTLPDFSNCGYMGGGVRIPDAPVKVTLKPDPKSADDTARIQAAIDAVAKLQPDGDGLRGAVLLTRGRYRINGQLKVDDGGIVLRGEGDSDNGTVLIAGGKDKRALVEIGGTSATEENDTTRVSITDDYVPVGARSFTVSDAASLKPGDTVIVARAGNAAWIREIGMDRIT